MKLKPNKGDPRTLVLADRNARYFPAARFKRLVDNIATDKALSQWPLVWHDTDTGLRHVLSGNHRVRAAIEAGFETIDWTETDEPLSRVPAARDPVVPQRTGRGGRHRDPR